MNCKEKNEGVINHTINAKNRRYFCVMHHQILIREKRYEFRKPQYSVWENQITKRIAFDKGEWCSTK